MESALVGTVLLLLCSLGGSAHERLPLSTVDLFPHAYPVLSAIGIGEMLCRRARSVW